MYGILSIIYRTCYYIKLRTLYNYIKAINYSKAYIITTYNLIAALRNSVRKFSIYV